MTGADADSASPGQARAGSQPVLLTVAGSDSGGGAGVQADVRTGAAHGVGVACALTAVTAQDSLDVRAVHAIPPAFVVLQVRTVLADLPVRAAKTGLLGHAAVAAAVGPLLAEAGRPWVVDPVLATGPGTSVGDAELPAAILRHLVPGCALLTPNLPEAALLLGLPRAEAAGWSRAEREQVARSLGDLGAAAVLLKGGHSGRDREESPEECWDLLATGGALTWLPSPWIDTPDVHGTGCMLSAAIAARLALGHPLDEAVGLGKQFLTQALRRARPAGRGRGAPDAWRAMLDLHPQGE